MVSKKWDFWGISPTEKSKYWHTQNNYSFQYLRNADYSMIIYIEMSEYYNDDMAYIVKIYEYSFIHYGAEGSS